MTVLEVCDSSQGFDVSFEGGSTAWHLYGTIFLRVFEMRQGKVMIDRRYMAQFFRHGTAQSGTAQSTAQGAAHLALSTKNELVPRKQTNKRLFWSVEM